MAKSSARQIKVCVESCATFTTIIVAATQWLNRMRYTSQFDQSILCRTKVTAHESINNMAENDAQQYICQKKLGAQPNRRSKVVITRAPAGPKYKQLMKSNLLASQLLQVCLCDLMSPHLICTDRLQSCLWPQESLCPV